MLATNTYSEYVILPFYFNSGCINAPQYYLIRTLPLLFLSFSHWKAGGILKLFPPKQFAYSFCCCLFFCSPISRYRCGSETKCADRCLIVTAVPGAYQVVTKSVSRLHALLNQSSALFDVTSCIPDLWREQLLRRQSRGKFRCRV